MPQQGCVLQRSAVHGTFGAECAKRPMRIANNELKNPGPHRTLSAILMVAGLVPLRRCGVCPGARAAAMAEK